MPGGGVPQPGPVRPVLAAVAAAGRHEGPPDGEPVRPDSPPWTASSSPVLVVAGGLDMLRDRAVDYAERLSAMGKPVELAEFAGEHHGFFTLGPGSDAAGELIAAVARFVDVAAPPPK